MESCSNCKDELTRYHVTGFFNDEEVKFCSLECHAEYVETEISDLNESLDEKDDAISYLEDRVSVREDAVEALREQLLNPCKTPEERTVKEYDLAGSLEI